MGSGHRRLRAGTGHPPAGSGPGPSIALALLAATLVVVSLGAPAAKAGSRADSANRSDERGLTQWAHPVHDVAPILARPTPAGRQIGRTHRRTEDGFPEVYPVLRSRSGPGGATWLKVRIPKLRQGRTGWVRAAALGPLYRVQKRLVIDQSRQRATLYKRGRKIWDAAVGIGAAATPTPTGHFWIREKFKVREEFKKSRTGNIYGPRAFGTSAYSVLSDWPGGGVIGIHGTNQPALIPGRPSHGCIRLRNAEVRKLYKLMPIGTPIRIRN